MNITRRYGGSVTYSSNTILLFYYFQYEACRHYMHCRHLAIDTVDTICTVNIWLPTQHSAQLKLMG